MPDPRSHLEKYIYVFRTVGNLQFNAGYLQIELCVHFSEFTLKLQ